MPSLLGSAYAFEGDGFKALRSQLNFPVSSPRNVIQFKSKCEESSFMRIASRIYTLPQQNRDEVIYTYQKVFKYLAELLEAQDFNKISFQNVNKFLEQIYLTKKEG